MVFVEREDAARSHGWDSPAVVGKALQSQQSRTEALTGSREAGNESSRHSLPSHRLCQPLSLSMSHTAHSIFFRKLFFPFLLSMETHNSNQKIKRKKETKKPCAPASLLQNHPQAGQCSDHGGLGSGQVLDASKAAF